MFIVEKDKAQQRLEEIRNEIRVLEKEAYELRCFIEELSEVENTKLFLNEISLVSKENSMSVWLTKNTKTTPIMDSFYNSDKVFLIFERIFLILSEQKNQFLSISLVVKKSSLGIKTINTGLTMTDLKKSSDNRYFGNYFAKDDRMYSLMEEIILAIDKATTSKQAIPFENPIRLGGQTYSNQTGYGSEYNGNDLISQGTLYGETTGFYIIGIIINNLHI